MRLRDRETDAGQPQAAFVPAVVTSQQAGEATLALQLAANGGLQLSGSAEQLADLLVAWQPRGGR